MPKTFSLTGEQSRIAERIRHNEVETFLLIVPTKRRIRHLTRQLLQETAAPGVPEPCVFTLGTLASRIALTAFEGIRLVDEAIQTLLFHQALQDVRSRLEYFRVRDRYPAVPAGTFDKITNVIRKLKETGVTPESLTEEIAEDEGDEQPKLRDICLLYSVYEQRLASLRAVDSEGVFSKLVLECPESRFRSTFKQLFPLVEEIAIVGFNEFTEPELGFIHRLCSLSLPVHLEFDFELGNTRLFGQLEENYRRFCDLGFKPVSQKHNIVSLDPFRRPPTDVRVQEIRRHFARTLFQHDRATAKEDCSAYVTLIRARDRVREVQFICSLIKHLALQRPGRDLSRVCVAMYRPQLYTAILREQFRKFGIPANITDRYQLSHSPVVSAIIGLLHVALRGFRRDDVVRAASSSYFDFGRRLDYANLLDVSREARILGGLDSWYLRIEKQIETLQTPSSEEEEECETRSRTTRLERYERARRDIQTLEHHLSPLRNEQTPSTFRNNLETLLESLRVPARIVAGAGTESSELVEKDARAYAKFLEVLELTTRLLEYQEGKHARHQARTLLEQLKVALSQERYNVQERFGQGVLVTSIEETRGLPIDVMIVAGLVDGEFPSVYQSELFFSARRLREREQRHQWESRYLFYQAVTNWSEHLYLTYPEQDGDLDLVRSTFVDAVSAVANIEQWEYPSSYPLAGSIFSEQELLQRYGHAVSSNADTAVGFIPAWLDEKARHVREAIQVERSRVAVHNMPEYEGRIGAAISPETRERLRQFRERVYSVSQLESYGRCPYQFFSRRLLQLQPSEELDEDLSPLEKGSVLHEILFEFYTERRERGLPPMMECTDEEFAQAYRRLVEIAEEKLNALDIPGAFWELQKEAMLGQKDDGRGLLYDFLSFERRRTTRLRPSYFEVGFGSQLGSGTRTDARLSTEEPIVAGTVRLKGKIDRVETDQDFFAVVDYKTGSQLPTPADIRAGLSLQLPLYLYTIECLLNGARRPAGAVYYQLRDPIGFKLGLGTGQCRDEFQLGRRSKVLDDDELRGLISQAIDYINGYVDGIVAGDFPLTTSNKIDSVCTYCDYKKICRIQTVRHLTAPKPEE